MELLVRMELPTKENSLKSIFIGWFEEMYGISQNLNYKCNIASILHHLRAADLWCIIVV